MPSPQQDHIIIQGAREHNLKNISLRIPKKKITVFTGVSGSGKSSLVFDTIAAESQRHLNETFDSFVRHRLPHYGRPDVDNIANLSVAIIIDQKRIGGNARSTVGTATDIYAMLRLLFSRVGQPFVGESSGFSFNNPQGMCPHCEGLGKVSTIDMNKLLIRNKSLNEGAINFPTFQPGTYRWARYVHSGYFDNNKKLKDFNKQEMEILLNAQAHKPKHPGKNWGKTVEYEGLLPRIERSFLKRESKENSRHKEAIAEVITQVTCPVCKGARLNEKVLSSRINKKNIADCAAMHVHELISFVNTIKADHFRNITQELIRKLQHLESIGLGYLSLSRETGTLSGGESQRIKMVKHLGNSLTDLIYIFDEPSVGLHPGDVHRLNELIRELRNKGNTILVVEHDPDIINTAEHMVDMGPGSGEQGGQIVYQGDLQGIRKADSITGKFLSQKNELKAQPRKPAGYLSIKNARLHNLKNVRVKIPLGIMTVVTGVAGSGKSSLINKVMLQQYPQVLSIDQSALRGSRRSNLATYAGFFDQVRASFAKANKVPAALFSTNSEGACPACKGLGIISTDLAFMDTVEDSCELCGGTGYKQEVLKYRFRNKNIHEVLELTVGAARGFFKEPEIADVLLQLDSVGLDYITLGQPLNTFSGGERQRIKIATELQNKGQIYVFDEPTTGLHMADIAKLMRVFDTLISNGSTVIIIEHDLKVISQADWIIDIGPGAGREGGKVIFEGTGADIIHQQHSFTGQYLRKYVRA